MQIASAKDKNPVLGDMCFYGVVTDIWDLDYNMFNIYVFKCEWFIAQMVSKLMSLGLH